MCKLKCRVLKGVDRLFVSNTTACKHMQACESSLFHTVSVSLTHTCGLRHMRAAIDDVFLWLHSRATSLTGHLLIPINHELSCIVSPASPAFPLLSLPHSPITFSLPVNKLWHRDSDVCATEWCLAAALIGEVLKCSSMNVVVMRLYFLALYDRM